ncbi:hypothetical protein, partial [Arsukibacterium sp.]|uniref:hypothetical protein n=1 Tax=Arsukibacterium sp. TaxID=1977258 RepID=UPI001BD4E766
CASASELLWRAKAGVAADLPHMPDTTLFLTRRGNYARLPALHPTGQLKLFKFVPDEFVARCLTAGAQTLPGSFKRGSILYS